MSVQPHYYLGVFVLQEGVSRDTLSELTSPYISVDIVSERGMPPELRCLCRTREDLAELIVDLTNRAHDWALEDDTLKILSCTIYEAGIVQTTTYPP